MRYVKLISDHTTYLFKHHPLILNKIYKVDGYRSGSTYRIKAEDGTFNQYSTSRFIEVTLSVNSNIRIL